MAKSNAEEVDVSKYKNKKFYLKKMCVCFD